MEEPDLVDPRPVTHIAELAARPRVCLQVGVQVGSCVLQPCCQGEGRPCGALCS